MIKTLLLVLLTAMPGEQLLQDILKGDYKAKTMTTQQMDSILNGPSEKRYQLCMKNKKTLFRRSWEADWYLQDTQKDKEISIGHGREALMSPNGKYVVYVKDNTLWIYKVDFGTEVIMTHEDNDSILCGVSDWLYEEEFSVTRLFAFSPDSRQVAFVRLDPRQIISYEWQEYMKTPLDKVLSSTTVVGPQTISQAYPLAGTPNAKAQLCVYDIQTKGIVTIPLGDEDEDFYLPRLCWRTLPGEIDKKTKERVPEYELLVEKVNRDQTAVEIVSCNPKSAVTHTLVRESSDEYFMDYELFDQWKFLTDGRFIALSEKDGYRRLYLYARDGTEIRCLTPEKRDVMQVYGLDPTEQVVYFEAATTPLTRHAYALNLKKGEQVCLTISKNGTHHLRLADDRTKAIDCFSNTTTPNIYTLYQLVDKGMQLKKMQTLEDNATLAQRWKSETHPQKQFFTFRTERGDSLNGWIMRPMEKKGKYPVIVLQYSGPASQRITNAWRVRFEDYLVTAGYVVVALDTRGTDGRGRDFRNQTYMTLGQKEAEDLQSLAAVYLPTLPDVDTARIALGGWSYGGYQTIRTMEETNSHYKCGFAVAPVSDWRFYDTGYTERYMRRPQVNEHGYIASSLLSNTDRLQGKLLLISGMADDNVHPQNTWMLVEALVQSGKQFDMQLYPDDNHFLRQRDNYLHLHQRIMRFLQEHL